MPSDRPGNVTLAQWAKDYTTDFQFDEAFNLAVDMGDDDRKSMILRAHDMMSGIEESVAPTM
jgi:hypothetical protein